MKAFSCFGYPGQRVRARLLASALLVLLGACVDAVPSTPTTTAPTEAFLSFAQGAGAPGPDIAIEPRFELELDVNGALKPGHPIHFTVRGSARFATQDAEVRLILPEVAAAERSSWELIEVPVGRFYQLTCPNPHPVGERTNMACALGEAFADWYAVVVRESDLPGWRRDLEENRMHLFHCGSRCTDDGSIVQGAVHAFLWDITDPGTGESHDAVQKSPLAVIDAIKTCEVKHGGSDWYAYNGIDHLIRCMERRPPYQVKLAKTHGSGDTVQTFFNTREQKYWTVDHRGYTVDNLSDAFRKLWLVNLYSRRINVGTGPILRNVEEEPAPELPQPTPCGMERMCYEPY